MAYIDRNGIKLKRLIALFPVLAICCLLFFGCVSSTERSSVVSENLLRPEQTALFEQQGSGVDVSSDQSKETDSGLLPDEDGSYSAKEDVALYIHLYGKLPSNFITKKQAQQLGWSGGSLEQYAPGKCIGGSYFGNYEGLLPSKDGRTYTECDIDTLGAETRGAKRLVFSNDGLIYYTQDHYESFILLYGDDGS